MKNFIYKGYTIEHRLKPIPSRCMDWEWTADDFDGGNENDNGCGFAPSRQAAIAAVDFDILEKKVNGA